MAENQTVYINTIFQLRRGKANVWTDRNPVLYPGEPGFELDTGRLKIGDGTQNWNTLPYINPATDASLVIDSNTNLVGISGFNTAATGTVPTKGENGVLTWITPVSSNNIENLIANSSNLNTIIENKVTNQISTLPIITFGGEAANVYIDENNNIILRDDQQQIVNANRGEVYISDNREFLWTGDNWTELGNEAIISNLATKSEVNDLRELITSMSGSGDGILTIATEETVGGVKSSENTDEIRVDENGIMHINEIGIDKLVNVDGIELVLDGGNVNKNI